jgi:SAM-dependent methyltransferase
VELIHTPHCRLCGQGPLLPRLVFRAPSQLTGEFYLVACQHCGTWQVNPHPGPKLTQSFFSMTELWTEGLDPDQKPVSPVQRSEQRRREYSRYAQAMIPHLPEGGLILDIGAGTGLMLSLLPEGRRKLAVEPNPAAAALARERGLEVTRQWAESLTFPSQPVSCLILNQALDHLPRPDLFLSRALGWLSPGGLVLLSGLINPRSLPARVYGTGHRLWHPFHQIYPPLAAVSGVLEKYGLEILHSWRPYFGTPGLGPGRLLKDSFRLLGAALLRPKGAVSPPWPGSTYSVLAKKKLLFQPLSARTVERAPLESMY